MLNMDENTVEIKRDNTELNDYFKATKIEVEELIQNEQYVKALEILKKNIHQQ